MGRPSCVGRTDTPTRTVFEPAPFEPAPFESAPFEAAPFESASSSAASLGSSALTDNASAASRTVVASGPFSDSPYQGTLPSSLSSGGTTPAPGLIPTSPHKDAGIRIEPSPSFPCAIGTRAALTAVALPPDEPPAVVWRFHGFLAMP